MKVAILSRSPASYSTNRLRCSLLERHHEVRVLDTLRFVVDLQEGRPGLTYRRKPLPRYDAVIPRIGASINAFGAAVVRQFERLGVYTLNGSHAISLARDELRTLQLLGRHGLRITPTVFLRRREDVLPTMREMGGGPVLLRLLEGNRGVGVVRVGRPEVAEAVLEAIQDARQEILVQQLLSGGRELRALVVGSRVEACMEKSSRGGEGRSVSLSPESQRLAVHAAQVLGLRVAGVDLQEGGGEVRVSRIQASPGLERIECTTGIDVVGRMVELVEGGLSWDQREPRRRRRPARPRRLLQGVGR